EPTNSVMPIVRHASNVPFQRSSWLCTVSRTPVGYAPDFLRKGRANHPETLCIIVGFFPRAELAQRRKLMIGSYFKWGSYLKRVLSTPAGPHLSSLAEDLHKQGFSYWVLRGRLQGA